jgi:2-hydroxy-6-oxonona-2,4-dienedioate hydrolase
MAQVAPHPPLTRPAPALAAVPDRDGSPPDEHSRWTRIDGLDVHGRCWVDRSVPADPAVVLVHGLGVASRMCRPVAHHLARSFPVYAPDLPGFGESDHPDGVLDIEGLGRALAAWVGAMGIGPVVLAGTSLGSQVALEAARLDPSAVRAVVLGSPIVDPSRRSWLKQLPLWQAEQSTQSFALRRLMIADYAKCGVGRVVKTFQAALRHRPEDVIPQVEAPVCWGSRDPLLRREWAQRLAEMAPDGELRVLPGALHAMSHESPIEFGRAITHYVTGTRRS